MDISKLLKSQRDFFATGATRDIDYRLGALGLLADALERREGMLIDALGRDLGKSPMESYMTELGILRGEVALLRKNLRRWARPRRVPAPLAQFPAAGRVHPQPYGQVLVMAPWNYPVQLSLVPLAGALAAGNTVVLKPSEDAPHTAAAREQLLGEVFRPEYIAVVQGGRKTGEALLEERFDYIFFTGGPAVGRAVMEAAARHLTPVTLELGGKSPCILDETADLPLAARRIAFGKFLNSGQTCVAPDYLLVPEGKQEVFSKLLRRAVLDFFGPAPLDSPDLPCIIHRRRLDRLAQLLEGQKILWGGGVKTDPPRMEPTLVDSPDPGSPLMEEEIFGPVLPVLPYRTLEEAIAFVNAREKPLALYLFSRDRRAWRRVLAGTSSGGACINDTVVHLSAPALPFGGVGQSGMGAYHGRASFDTFTHYRGVLRRGLRPDLPIRYPPYNDKKLALIRRLLK